MSEVRSPAAQALLDGVVTRSGFDTAKAEGATTLVAAYLLANLSSHQAGILRGQVAEIDELAEEGRRLADDITAGRAKRGRATLTGRVLSSVGGIAGGREGGVIAATTTLIGQLGKLGLDVGDMRALGEAMIEAMRERTGSDYIDRMIARAKAKIPVLGTFLG